MRYRSTDMTGKVARLTRYNLSVDDERELLRMAAKERRSLANMVSVLIEEAIASRKRALLHQKAGRQLDEMDRHFK